MTPPHTPQNNGKAERLNRTLAESIRSWLIGNELTKQWWAELALASVYIKNRLYSNVVGDVPLHKYCGRNDDIRYLLPVGPCYVFDKRHERKGTDKLDPRAQEGIIVGYHDSRNYRVLVNGDVVISHHVKAKPRDIDVVTAEAGAATSPDSSTERSQEELEIADTLATMTHSNVAIGDDPQSSIAYVVVTDGLHCVAAPSYDWALVNATSTPRDPITYEEAMDASDRDFWKDAINSEINSLVKNNTWVKVDAPEGRPIITNKWVFKVKTDQDGKVAKYKARLVARGYSQQKGIDYHETFAPVGRMTTLRFLVALACKLGLHLRHFDVETAFLNGICEEEIYMFQPKGFEDGTNQVLKLKKCIYGLKQAPLQWHRRLCEVLSSAGFVETAVDSCLFERSLKGSAYALILIYVDDLVVVTPTETGAKEVLNVLQAAFITKDLGTLRWYLGIKVC